MRKPKSSLGMKIIKNGESNMETLGSIMILLGIILFVTEGAYSIVNEFDSRREILQAMAIIILCFFLCIAGITIVNNTCKQPIQEIVTNAPTKLNINGEEYLLIKNE